MGEVARGNLGALAVIDPDSHIPPYEQVRAQLEVLAETGTLAPGHKLPTVRRLADDLGLAPNTVARAYRELEQAGVLVTRGRNGTFIAVRGSDRAREGAVAAHQFARRARELGIAPTDALEMARVALDAT